jgi:copper homeostasis protein
MSQPPDVFPEFLPMSVPVEICVEGLASALQAGPASRIELCENLAVGGVTPSAGAIAVACERLSIPVHVLIRPRGGNFIYDNDELLTMKRDVQAAKGLGASGVVLGLLTGDRKVDLEKTAWLIEQARPLSVTFHKAFDEARDPFEALDDLITLGVDRVLTSGQAPTAFEGLKTLVDLTNRSNGRIVVMAGGSITLEQIRPIIEAGVKEIHLGSAACLRGITETGLVRKIRELASMTTIYHITTRLEWEQAQEQGSYRAESLATEGFIHASTADQLAGTARRFYEGREGLVVLKIELDRLKVAIDWAKSPHSPDPFPHLLGPLNCDAVVEVVPLVADDSGGFAWPAETDR